MSDRQAERRSIFDGELSDAVRAATDHIGRGKYTGPERRKETPMTHSIFNEGVPPYPDFEIQNEGSILLLRPLTDSGAAWIGEHITNEETQFWGNAVVVEHRYIGDIVEGIQSDGLTVR